MQQRKPQNVFRAADAALSTKQSRAAHRKEFLRAEIYRVEPRPVAATVTDRQIDLLTRKIDVVHGCRDIELNFGMGRGKPSETMNQPGFLASPTSPIRPCVRQ